MPTRRKQDDFFGGRARRPVTSTATVPAQGYAAKPGTGPQGETCGSCTNCVFKQLKRRFYKCRLMARAWTYGRETDINIGSPACSHWQPGKPTATGIV